MKKIRNSLNYCCGDFRGEVNNLPSQTVPDLTLSVQQIYQRFTRGSSLPVMDTWDDEEPELELPDPRTLDLSERANYAEHFQQEIFDIRKPKTDIDEKDEPEQAPGDGE